METTWAEILFWASVGFLLAGSLVDMRSSKDFIYYGVTEANKLWRDKWGFFDLKKNLVWTCVMAAGTVALKLIPAVGNRAFVIGLLIGGVRLIQASLNFAGLRRDREEQLQFLRELKRIVEEGDDPYAVNNHFAPRNFYNQKHGRSYYELFPWIHTSTADVNDAVQEIRGRLIALVQNPEEEWFPK